MFAASIQDGGVLAKKQVSKQPRYNAGLISHGRANLWVWHSVCHHEPMGFPMGLSYIAIARQMGSL